MTLAEKLRAQAEKKAKKREEKKNLGAAASEPESVVLPTVKHTIKTHELLRQAEVVSKNAKIKIPDAIVHVVSRAIKARRRCAAWFQKTGLDNGHSNEGHAHFIEVLEKAMGILKPDFETSNSQGKTDKVAETQATATKSKARSTAHDLSGLSNRFSNLDVEDTEGLVDTETTIQSLSSTVAGKSAQKTAPPKAVDIYELEYDDSFDRLFDVFCFFEDLHRLQDFLTDTWRKYKTFEIDLLSVSLTTNAALDIIRREEEAVMNFVFPHSSQLDYTKLAACVFFAESLTMPGGPGAMMSPKESLRITPFDNFIYLPTARTLMKCQPFFKLKVQVCSFYQPLVMNFLISYSSIHNQFHQRDRNTYSIRNY